MKMLDSIKQLPNCHIPFVMASEKAYLNIWSSIFASSTAH